MFRDNLAVASHCDVLEVLSVVGDSNQGANRRATICYVAAK